MKWEEKVEFNRCGSWEVKNVVRILPEKNCTMTPRPEDHEENSKSARTISEQEQG